MDEILVSNKASRLPPAIADFGIDSFVVVWTDVSDTAIKGQRFGISGRKSFDEFQVNTTTAGIHHGPAVARLFGFPAGFIVAWIADHPPVRDVLFQRFSDDGRKFGEVRANSKNVNPGRLPAIVSLLDGNFVVCWTDSADLGGIRARIFSTDGTARGSEFQVNTSAGVH